MRLIDEAYLQAHKVHGVIGNVEGDFVSGVTIAHAPTIDAVPVVRCKDCKYYSIRAYGRVVCWCSRHGIVVEDMDFCSRGELKEDNGCEID